MSETVLAVSVKPFSQTRLLTRLVPYPVIAWSHFPEAVTFFREPHPSSAAADRALGSSVHGRGQARSRTQ